MQQVRQVQQVQEQVEQQQPQQQQRVPLSPASAMTFVNAVFDDALLQYTAPYASGRSSVLPVLARSGAGAPTAVSAVRTARARPLPDSLRAARVAAAALR